MRQRLLLLAVSFFLTCASATQGEERRYSLLEREIEYLMSIWPGDYDNREQLLFDVFAGKPTLEDGAHVRVHSHVRRVSVPWLGEYVFYVEDNRDNDSTAVIRQRLYEFVADEDLKVIRVRQHDFVDAARWRMGPEAADPLSGISESDLQYVPDCDLILKRDVDALVGGTTTGSCEDGDSESVDYQLRLTETGIAFRDSSLSSHGYDADGAATLSGWYQLEKARWFQCMVDFPREEGGRPVNTVDYVRIHDQGGSYPFTYLDGRDMVLTLRNNWSFGMQRETLVVVVQETDEEGPTLVYGWTEPGADRIGVNPGWIRLQCDLDTPKMRKFQQWLRPDS